MSVQQVLNKGRIHAKLWLDNLESSAFDQVTNLTNLPFAFHHVAIMPDAHAGRGTVVGSVLATQGAIVPNCVGVDIGCFSGDTRIPLVSGKQESLAELESRTEPFLVYASTPDKKITAALAVCRKTRLCATLVSVTLDSGEKIRCTPDHKFRLRDGSYREAESLKTGDRLFPFYQFVDKDGYEVVYIPKTRTYQRFHWVLARNGRLGQIPGFDGQKTIIHHKDFDKRNNLPENLEFMGASDHLKFHRSIAERNTYWQSPDFEAKRIAGIRDKIANDPEFLELKGKIGTENITKYMSENREEFLEKIAENGERGKKYLVSYNKSEKGRAKTKEIMNRIYECELCGQKCKGPSAFAHHKRKFHDNHKVLLVEPLLEKEDVYCLTVEDFHNFAISSGVFVHNCGMTAVRVWKYTPTRDEIKKIMRNIREKIPVGFESRQFTHKRAKELDKYFASKIVNQFAGQASYKQLGTLGGGNHFIEIQKDGLGQCYIMIHSGSRNLGKRVAEHFDNVAKEINRKLNSVVPPSWDLAFLPEGSDELAQYLEAMEYCCCYAELNRSIMLELAMDAFFEVLPREGGLGEILDVRHNYVAKETHFGEEVFVHRKGAVRADEGKLVIIPGSQGTKSFIAAGLGNPDSFLSCSHGSGRKLSRSAAKKSLDLAQEQAMMDALGVVHGIRNESDLDEAPGAYKDLDQVMAFQDDLVKPLFVLTPVGVVKG